MNFAYTGRGNLNMTDCLKTCSHAGLLPELCHGAIPLQHTNRPEGSTGSEHPSDARKSRAILLILLPVCGARRAVTAAGTAMLSAVANLLDC